MSYNQTVIRSAFLASFCLVASVGNSAHATLFPVEQLGGLSQSGPASYGSLLPRFLIQDHLPVWNSAGPATPEIEFNLLGWSTADDLIQVGNQVPEVSLVTELRLSGPPLGHDQGKPKATYLAAQLMEQQISSEKIRGLRRESPNFRMALRPQSKPSLSWVTWVEISVYGTLALLALGALGLAGFNWNQRRLKRLAFESFANISESDLMMARFSQLPPPGSWNEFKSPEESSARPQSGVSRTN